MSPCLDMAVVIPGYGRPALLVESLASVEAQTHPPAELIVVDDGSPEPLEPVVAPFLDRHPTWRCVRQENGGGASARNRGLQETRSPLVAFLDADDLFEPQKLERHQALFDADYDLGLTFSACLFFSAERGPLKVRPERAPEGEVLVDILDHSFISSLSSVVVHRRCFEQCGPFDSTLRVVDDYHFYYRCAREFRFGFLPEPLVRYRCHDQNLSVRALERGHDERVRIFRELSLAWHDAGEDVRRVLRKKLAYYLVKHAQDRARQGAVSEAKRLVEEARRIDPWSLRALKYELLYKLRGLFGRGFSPTLPV